MRVPHHFTIDVEEYFHPTALEGLIPRERWDGLPRRSPELVEWILDHLSEREVIATFFFLGWLAEKEPDLVRSVSERGHEIASHGWGHHKVTSLSPDRFREDVRRSRALLQDLIGRDVVGYRAPSFSILPGVEWALDVLIEEGFRYDSSMFPVRVHPGYGYPDAERDPHLLHRAGGILAEIPPATLKVGPLNLPAAGGAYLRFFPSYLVIRALGAAEDRGVPGTVYVHPWEFDSQMPDIPAPGITRLRMLGGIRHMKRRVSAILKRFRFVPMRDTAEALLSNGEGAR